MDKIVANLHLNDGADPGKAEDHHRDQSAVPQPEEIRQIGRLGVIGWFLGDGDALEQCLGFLDCQDRRLAFLDRVAWAPDGMGRISVNNMETPDCRVLKLSLLRFLGGESSASHRATVLSHK